MLFCFLIGNALVFLGLTPPSARNLAIELQLDQIGCTRSGEMEDGTSGRPVASECGGGRAGHLSDELRETLRLLAQEVELVLFVTARLSNKYEG